MRAKTLIERLQRFDENAEVRLHSAEGEEVLFVLAKNNDTSTIWLETESDVDMSDEIQTRFDDAIENGLDELDVYSELLETGINVPMVEKYMGKKEAEHMMEFCVEHGILNGVVCIESSLAENQKVLDVVDEALKQYGTDIVSVDMEDNMIHVNLCSVNWSDAYMRSVARFALCNPLKLVEELDKRNVGHCGF